MYNRRVSTRATEVHEGMPLSNSMFRKIKILVQLRREVRRFKRQIQSQKRDQAARPVICNDSEATRGHNRS